MRCTRCQTQIIYRFSVFRSFDESLGLFAAYSAYVPILQNDFTFAKDNQSMKAPLFEFERYSSVSRNALFFLFVYFVNKKSSVTANLLKTTSRFQLIDYLLSTKFDQTSERMFISQVCSNRKRSLNDDATYNTSYAKLSHYILLRYVFIIIVCPCKYLCYCMCRAWYLIEAYIQA